MAEALQADRLVAKQLLGGLRPEEIEIEGEIPAVSFQEIWASTPGALEALGAQSAALAAADRAQKLKRKGEKKKRKRRR